MTRLPAAVTAVRCRRGGGGAGGARTGAGGGPGRDVGGQLFVRLGVLREGALDAILEGEVERLGGEVADDVGHVTAPEGAEALLRGDAGEAVDDAGVAGDLAGDDLGVGILGLDEELDALDGGGRGLGDGAGDATLFRSSGVTIDRSVDW